MKSYMPICILSALIYIEVILILFNKKENDENLFLQITTRIEQLPDCALKSNLRAAALAEYEDESEELNDVIQKYHEEQIKKLNE